MFEYQILAWLKAGIMADKPENSFETNEQGTTQGGVILPLLMNIALHGMEYSVVRNFGKNEIKVVRYVDDFVIFGKSLESVQKAKEIIKTFLKPIGLELSEEKIRIARSMEKLPGTEVPPELDFLGYHFKNVKCSIHRGVKST